MIEKLEDIEVTPEMIVAGMEFYPCRDDADESNAFFLTGIYRTMHFAQLKRKAGAAFPSPLPVNTDSQREKSDF